MGEQWWRSSREGAVVVEQWWGSSGGRAVVEEQRWRSSGGAAMVIGAVVGEQWWGSNVKSCGGEHWWSWELGARRIGDGERSERWMDGINHL